MKGFFAIDSITPWLLCSAVAHGVLIAELPWNHESPEIAVSSGSSPLHVSLVTPLVTSDNVNSEEKVSNSQVIAEKTLIEVPQALPVEQLMRSVKEMPAPQAQVNRSSSTPVVIATVAESKHSVSITRDDSEVSAASKTKTGSTHRPQPKQVEQQLHIAKTEPEISQQEKPVPILSEAAKPKPVNPKPVAQKSVPQLALAESSSYTKRIDREDSDTNPEEIEKTPLPVTDNPDRQDTHQSDQSVGNTASSRSRGGQQSPGKEYFLREAKGALQLALGNSFTYPQKARKRNWQGDVLLQVNVLADGKIESIKLLESSGYGLLDRNAIRSVQSIGQLVVSQLDLDLQIQIPVSYQLTNR